MTAPAPAPAEGQAARPQLFSLGQILVEAGLLSPEEVSRTQEAAREENLPFWQVLVRDSLVTSQDLAALTALRLGLTTMDLRNQIIEPEAVANLPERLARRYRVLPIRQAGGRLIVAMADPTDLRLIQDLAALTGYSIDPVVATADDIMEHIDISYRLTETQTARARPGPAGTAVVGGRITAATLQQVPPARVLDLLLQQAAHDRASDIHINPAETQLRVRFRIDGILHDIMTLPLEMHPTIVSRIKIMSGMNIAERRRPQDGQLSIEVQDRKVDIRAAVSNTVAGEMAVLRLLDKGASLLNLNQLGMGPRVMEQYRQLLRLPYGIVIVCGPTGSGKSTTLYASIQQIDRKERNVISIEDPVEYRINDVNQMQVHPEAGVTFATQLRSILRLDPDVVLVGEIRDQETAIIAIQAALTGHLVLTSLHANDAISSLLRLKDLGIAPYLLAASVGGVVAQRMVRVVCKSCQGMATRPIAEQRAYAAIMGESREQFVYGSGCNMCAHTGYRGRSGVFEILTMSEALRQAFLSDASRDDLTAQATKEGLSPLRREGMLKVREGVTTPYEVMRVLFTLD